MSVSAKSVRTCVRSCSQVTVAISVPVGSSHGPIERMKIATMSFAAAVLLTVPGAEAGVIMAQPELKKAFQGSSSTAVKASTTSAPTKNAPEPKEEKQSEPIEVPSLGIDVRAVGLPASIGFVAGLAFLASKLDGDFEEFMSSTLIKDSNLGQSGLGYEEVIKGTYGGIYGEPTLTQKGKKQNKRK
ncbi:hypothetical protein CEUSTIGMA_g11641.t1 [Chlamydomonas eustigma]|uniref:Uncharacterized protein n=1 Tax=Chlamydomonas eustigma TaxID=1157962 RepID=A0A250XMC2_9CHLO|nr:hypothetical protein CEUSTIGMA_g11641.t1 [Chlamydomonas eustigma]|eukprot:GAX84218.1 hypothetical protein CEUSTIGMA_g11641.t1 [Chlamydomonas eustigma]